MRRAWLLYVVHVAALGFGLAGILIAVPNPHLWADSEFGARTFRFGMDYGGATHIIFGALAMLAFGFATLGRRKTLIFFALAYPISLSAELIGTTTGLPFGDYAYTSGLGLKVLGHVPFTIPLSWFYLGFASYVLGTHLARRYLPRHASLGGVLAGVYLLVVWDLVLDPAMAHEALPVKFWQWSDTGPYFGMPLINFAGWALTGFIFIGAARLLWRASPGRDETPAGLPFMVYVANTVFAMALSLSVGLWQPVVISGVLGVVPAAAALRLSVAGRQKPATGTPMGQMVVKRGAELLLRRSGTASTDPQGWSPPAGPAILVCRHYHHLWDGCALISQIDRPLHIVVGLDWIEHRPLRVAMEAACRSAGWPIVLRSDALARQDARSAYTTDEVRPYLRRAVIDAQAILEQDGLIVFFAEAYPNIDPGYTPKHTHQDMLPFRQGFARIAALFESRTGKQLPIIPVGLEYMSNDPLAINIKFAEAAFASDFRSTAELVAAVEARVTQLSSVVEREPDGAQLQVGAR